MNLVPRNFYLYGLKYEIHLWYANTAKRLCPHVLTSLVCQDMSLSRAGLRMEMPPSVLTQSTIPCLEQGRFLHANRRGILFDLALSL